MTIETQTVGVLPVEDNPGDAKLVEHSAVAVCIKMRAAKSPANSRVRCNPILFMNARAI